MLDATHCLVSNLVDFIYGKIEQLLFSEQCVDIEIFP
jgi:hypothetical protein